MPRLEQSIRLFALTSGHLSAAEAASPGVAAWPAIVHAVARHPAPALFNRRRPADAGSDRRFARHPHSAPGEGSGPCVCASSATLGSSYSLPTIALA